jgi:hypothetical protein
MCKKQCRPLPVLTYLEVRHPQLLPATFSTPNCPRVIPRVNQAIEIVCRSLIVEGNQNTEADVNVAVPIIDEGLWGLRAIRFFMKV